MHSINGSKITVESTANDSLLIMNSSDFFICNTCGYGVVAKPNELYNTKPEEHKNPYGQDCNGILERLNLGHIFKTDVAQIYFNNKTIPRDSDTAFSVLYALLESVSQVFDIDRNDIRGCLKYAMINNEYNVSFILFDSVPGGAGHVRRIGEANTNEFITILRRAYDIMNNCTCGGDIGNTSCYNCLRNYYNQQIHEKLQRRLAIDFLKNFI